jgi:hypothetical protein
VLVPRGVGAVDFLVEDEDMLEVARWIAANCDFDLIYYYGKDRPLHVTWGPDNSCEAYELTIKSGRRVPRPLAL